MPKSANSIADIILRSGLVDEMQMKAALAKQQQWGGSLALILAETGTVTEDALIELLGDKLRIAVMHLGNRPKDAAALAKLDAEFCEQHGVFPVQVKNRSLTLGMYNPADIATIDEAQLRAGMRVVPVLVSETEVRNAILKHYRHQQPEVQSSRVVKALRRSHQTSEYEMPMELQTTGMAEPLELPEEAPDESTQAAWSAGTDGLSADDLSRIEEAQQHQEKTASIMRALTELLEEKGLLTNRQR
ncbi:MAG: hypothetical protein K1X64_14380 [Myxococcaceae bacterium]|nr:hypothetical protein [Myxococcaceae bacterium]